MTTTGREAWRRRVTLSGPRPFLYVEGRTWTYDEVAELSRCYAGALRELGVEQGTRVMVGLSNRPETMIMLVAVLQLGAVAVPLQGGLTFPELAYQIEHCESTVLVADDTVAQTVLPRIGELSSVRTVIADDFPAATTALSALAEGPPLPWTELPGHHDRSPALVLYTSGSTGRPKGVVLPAGAFPSAGAAFNDRFGFTAADNYFLPLTMSHALGVVTAPAMAVMAGGTITLAERFSPGRFWHQVERSGATASILFPTHLNLLLETEQDAPAPGTSPLRLVITHAWNERFRARFGAELVLVWGMTETGAVCTGSCPGERFERAGFVGTPMVGVRVQVRNERGRPVEAGRSGEICLHHPHAMIEYLKDPDATARTVVDGWVRSGDLGTLDGDGRLYYRGRLKNMIKRSGENISAEGVALVATVRAGVDAPAILMQAGAHLVRWKLPRYVVLTDRSLPRLSNGKLDRLALRAAFDPAVAHDRERA